MSWTNSLISLYDRNQGSEGLMPKYHSEKTANITVYLSADGEFKKAEVVSKADAKTIAPQTEKSAVRTSNKAPAPLFDQWCYLDETYASYTTGKRTDSEIKVFQQATQEYLTNLLAWCESEYSHPKIRAIYRYLSENSVIQDVQAYDSKLLKYDKKTAKDRDGEIADTWLELSNSFVRFVVFSDTPEVNTDDPDECWKNRQIRKCWQSYRETVEQNSDRVPVMDYLTGEYQPEAVSCPQGLIPGDFGKTKLISSNDKKGLTYLGRFHDSSEAFRIGSDSSMMLHDAFKWVFQKQGRIFGDLAVMAWTDNDAKLPDFNAGTGELLSGRTMDCNGTIQAENVSFDDDEDENAALAESAELTEDVSSGNSNQNDEVTAKVFLDLMNGGTIPAEKTFESLHVMAFTAPSSGALAVADYQEMSGAEYYQNLWKWHTEGVGKWRQYGVKFAAMPSLYRIAALLYGHEEKKGQKTVMAFGSKDSASIARAYQELIPCVWYGKRIPLNVVRRAVERASNPMKFQEKKNWRDMLSLACILVRKYRIQYKNEGGWTMNDQNSIMTDEEKKEARAIVRHGCDYKYGAMMAIAEQIELEACKNNPHKTTNVDRFFHEVMARPGQTWPKVFDKIQRAYLCKLPEERRNFYKDQLGFVGMTEEDTERRTRLDGKYLVGYSKKRSELFMKNKNADKQGAENSNN